MNKSMLLTRLEEEAIIVEVELDSFRELVNNNFILGEIEVKALVYKLELLKQEIVKENKRLGNPEVVNIDTYLERVRVHYRKGPVSYLYK